MSEFFRALERAERERARRSSSDTPGRPGGPSDSMTPHPHDTPAPAPDVVAPAMATAVEDPAPNVFAAAVIAEPPVVAEPVAPEATVVAEPPPPPRPPLTVALRRATTGATGEVDEHLVSLITPGTFEADQYRVLRHMVEQRRRANGLAIVAVTSAAAGDGKTTTAINLAGALGQDRGARVLLIDCDLRNSAVPNRLGLADGRGLVQLIVDPSLSLEDGIRHLPRFNLDVMAAGFETAAPYELLKSPRIVDLFEAARRRYDYVVVDTPPVVPFPDCRVLAKVVDGFLLVVAAHRTPRRAVEESLEVLPKESVVAVVFNGENQALARSYQAYYGGGDAAEAASGRWRSSARRAWAKVGGA
jgi:capsular exopolysaccharide synthesis family protein